MKRLSLAAGAAIGLSVACCQGPIERLLDLDEERSVVLNARACEDGDARACTNIADVLLTRDRSGDSELAIQLLVDACDASAHLACVRLADTLGEEDARPLLDRSCTAGEPMACLHLGDLERASNSVRAYGLYGLACEDRIFDACYKQGVMLKAGEGVSRDPEAAFALFRDLCANGGAAGCRENAKEMLDPASGHANRGLGEVLAQRACTGGDAEGCWVAALAAETDDDADAFRARACEFGFEQACDGAR
jgi:hypothetical protein